MRPTTLLLFLPLAVACGAPVLPTPDAGPTPPDAGPTVDAGTPDPFISFDAGFEPAVHDSSMALPVELETLSGLTLTAHTGDDAWAVIRSDADFQLWFGQAAPIALGAEWLVLYNAGLAPQPDERALILEAAVEGDTLRVITTRVQAPAGCSSPFSRERALHVVRFQSAMLKDTVKKALFLQRTVTMDCTEVQRQVSRWQDSQQFFHQMDGTYAVVDVDPVDENAWSDRSLELLLSTPGNDRGFRTLARRTLLQFPMGHAYLYGSDADARTDKMPYDEFSSWGVCGRPNGDGVVVTVTTADSPLGLQPGDKVVALNNVPGAAMTPLLIGRAQSGQCLAAAVAGRYQAAAALFSVLRQGDVLTVQRGTGAPLTVRVGPGTNSFLWCRDPWNRDRQVAAEATRRADGTAVIRLPSFYPANLDPAATDMEITAAIAAMRADIAAKFDSVKDAPQLIWDLRGNSGGASQVGLDIVSGMPTARATPIATCKYRVNANKPGVFADNPAIDYQVMPGGDFAYTGKVAVVTDGLAISAADYFLYAVEQATDTPRFGSSGASAYGSPGAQFTVSSDPAMFAGSDSNLCLSSTGVPLEGHQVVPTLEVDLAPADVAQGVDTQLEAASSWLLAH